MTTHSGRVKTGDRSGGLRDTDDRDSTVSTAELLALFGDAYTCDILRSLEGGPAPAKELVEECDMSRPTAYRRLNRLTDAGLVAEQLEVAPDGHHRKEFHLVIDTVTFELVGEGITGHIDSERSVSD